MDVRSVHPFTFPVSAGENNMIRIVDVNPKVNLDQLRMPTHTKHAGNHIWTVNANARNGRMAIPDGLINLFETSLNRCRMQIDLMV